VRDTSRRREQISTLIREHGNVRVAPLASRFGVSMQTIRKDFGFLVARGVMERSHGGGMRSAAASTAPGLGTKRSIYINEEMRIGQFAASMILPADVIALGSGTTTLQIARHLLDHEDLTVITNDLDILAVLAQKRRLNVVMLGGMLRRRNGALYGAQAHAAVDGLRVDKLFLGVDGFDSNGGLTTHYEPEAVLNRKMVEAARQVIVVADRSKFGRTCLHRFIGINKIHDLVVDGGVPDDVRAVGDRVGMNIHQV
jgi:DeoR family transcriptional regulator of aga operon